MSRLNRAHRRIEIARIMALQISGCLPIALFPASPQTSQEQRGLDNQEVRDELSSSSQNAPHTPAS